MQTNPLKRIVLGRKVDMSALFVCSVLYCFLSGGVPAANAADIAWQEDLNQAVALSEKTNRLLLVHFYGDNCPPCKLMDANVFTDPTVVEAVNRDFIAVKIHTARQPALANRFGVKAIPTDIVLKPNGQLLHRRQGGIDRDRFVQYLAYLVDKSQKETLVPAPGQQPVAMPSIVPSAAPPLQAAPMQAPVAQETTLRDPFTKQVVIVPPTAAPPMPAPAIEAPPSIVPPAAAQAPMIVPGPAVTHSVAMNTAPPVTQVPAFVAENPAEVPTWSDLSLKTNTSLPTIAAAPVSGFQTPPPGPPSNVDEVPKTMVEVPLGLEGYCPVILGKEERWVPGNPAYYTMFRGHVFRFSSEQAMEEFVGAPLKFAPVAMGEDIVQMVDRNKKIYGNRKFGVWYQGRVFLFSSQESLDAFAERPEFYAEIAVKYETAFKGVHGLF